MIRLYSIAILRTLRNGINLNELARQQKETAALRAIASKKRGTAGFYAAAGRYFWGPEVVDDQLNRKRHAEGVQSEQEHKKIDAHMALANKVYAIRMLNKQPAELTASGQWHKRKKWRYGTIEWAIIHYQQ